MRFEEVADLLKPGYLPFESGVVEVGDGFKTIAALTRMPNCRAEMVHWWFGWLGGTEQYKLWHPVDHVFSDWEGRENGNYIGGSHLVHEYLGGRDGEVHKLRINFRSPGDFLGDPGFDNFDGVAVAARIGLLEPAVDTGRMVHFVRNTEFGCEMRSRFFLGDIAAREGGPQIDDPAALRDAKLTMDFCQRLHRHAIEEMGYLADLLPSLYRQVNMDPDR